MTSNDYWYTENINDGLKISYLVLREIFSGKSDFQKIDFLETKPFGKALLLDGNMQSSEKDEFIYHEMLVFPALIHHRSPKRVLIMGGGEGATARNVLLSQQVEKCIQVDIDPDVCRICCEHLPQNKSIYDDPRFELIVDDAKRYLEKTTEMFDIIISDLPEPIPGGPCYQLYTQEFYHNVLDKKLNSDGIFVAQSGSAEFTKAARTFTILHNTMKSVWSHVIAYSQYIPSFSDNWGFNLVLKGGLDPVQGNYDSGILSISKYLDLDVFSSAQEFNKIVKEALSNEKRLYTNDSPPMELEWQKT